MTPVRYEHNIQQVRNDLITLKNWVISKMEEIGLVNLTLGGHTTTLMQYSYNILEFQGMVLIFPKLDVNDYGIIVITSGPFN